MYHSTAVAGRRVPALTSGSQSDVAQSTFAHITDTVRLVVDVPHATILVFPRHELGAEGFDHPLRTLLAEAFSRNEPVVIDDVSQDPRCARWVDSGGDDLRDMRSLVLVPFHGTRGVIGALVCSDDKDRRFTQRDRAILSQFALCILSELDLHERAMKDDLTGLMRRQPFMHDLEGMMQRHAADGTPSVLSIVDLDHFKMINDRFGHHVGDKVLRAVAEAFRENLGRHCHVCRLGGEEFAIAFNGVTLRDALPALQRLREAIASMTFIDQERVKVTASFGVAEITPALANVPSWCKMADAALYGAKEAGRNQVRIGFQKTLCDVPQDGEQADGAPQGDCFFYV